MMKTPLLPTLFTSLSSDEALDFLMKSEEYHSFELPEYFDFEKVLDYVRETIGDKTYEECCSDVRASELKGVNFDILLNKDGHYAVRPLVLSNPYLYYFLAREICGGENWERVKKHFEMCNMQHIASCALPIVPKKTESFHRSETILNWWRNMEQRSIELSLEYRYMFATDITNCYGSIDPRTIDWALSRRATSVPTDENHTMAGNIMLYLRDLQGGRNIGIPQGSTLYDLMAEIILAYADLLLAEKLKDRGVKEGYEILRYRDDYRVFSNDRRMLEIISYALQEVLESLNFRMNSQKTQVSDSIITDSIKPDKLFSIFNTPIVKRFKKDDERWDFDGLQKHLLYILMFARKFPNGGQVRVMLSQLDHRIEKKLKPKKVKEKVMSISLWDDSGEEDKDEEEKVWKEREVTIPGRIVENVRAMCAIATQIALENIGVAHYALRIVSRLVNSLDSKDEKDDIIRKVSDRLISLPNSTYNKIWLQNMTYRADVESGCKNRYDVVLCRVVMGEDIALWNNDWLKAELREGFPQTSVVNRETLAEVGPIITFRETRRYAEVYDCDSDDYDDDDDIDITPDMVPREP